MSAYDYFDPGLDGCFKYFDSFERTKDEFYFVVLYTNVFGDRVPRGNPGHLIKGGILESVRETYQECMRDYYSLYNDGIRNFRDRGFDFSLIMYHYDHGEIIPSWSEDV